MMQYLIALEKYYRIVPFVKELVTAVYVLELEE